MKRRFSTVMVDSDFLDREGEYSSKVNELATVFNCIAGMHVFEVFGGDYESLPYIDIEYTGVDGILGLICFAQWLHNSIHGAKLDELDELDEEDIFVIGEHTYISIKWHPRIEPYIEISTQPDNIAGLIIIFANALQHPSWHYILDKLLSSLKASKYDTAESYKSNVSFLGVMGISRWGADA